jgi:DNA polymerase III delta prime subunit
LDEKQKIGDGIVELTVKMDKFVESVKLLEKTQEIMVRIEKKRKEAFEKFMTETNDEENREIYKKLFDCGMSLEDIKEQKEIFSLEEIKFQFINDERNKIEEYFENFQSICNTFDISAEMTISLQEPKPPHIF